MCVRVRYVRRASISSVANEHLTIPFQFLNQNKLIVKNTGKVYTRRVYVFRLICKCLHFIFDVRMFVCQTKAMPLIGIANFFFWHMAQRRCAIVPAQIINNWESIQQYIRNILISHPILKANIFTCTEHIVDKLITQMQSSSHHKNQQVSYNSPFSFINKIFSHRNFTIEF